MTVRHSAFARPPDPASERTQREHELSSALTAARTLQARLEMLGDRAADVAVVRSLRDSLARDLVVNDTANTVDGTGYVDRKVELGRER